MKRILNRCPICGAPLKIEEFCQYSRVHFLTSKGKASKNYKRVDTGESEGTFIYCSNEKCNFVTDTNYESEQYRNIKIWEDTDGFWVDDKEE